MSSLKKLSESVKAEARKAGKLPIAPKKPKAGASLSVLETYITRHNAYVEKVNAMAAKYRKASSIKKQIFG